MDHGKPPCDGCVHDSDEDIYSDVEACQMPPSPSLKHDIMIDIRSDDDAKRSTKKRICDDETCKDKCSSVVSASSSSSAPTSGDKASKDKCSSSAFTTTRNRSPSSSALTCKDKCSSGASPSTAGDKACKDTCSGSESGPGDTSSKKCANTGRSDEKTMISCSPTCKDKCSSGNNKTSKALSLAEIQELKMHNVVIICCDVCVAGGVCCGTACCAVVCCLVRAWEKLSEVEMIPMKTPASTPGVITLQMSVTGLDCAGCAELAQSKLLSLGGVIEARVSSVTNSAEITMDPTTVSEERILDALNSLGYPSSIKSRRETGDPSTKITVSTLALLMVKVFTESEQVLVKESIIQAGAKSCSIRSESGGTRVSIDYDPERVGARVLFGRVSACIPGVVPSLAPFDAVASTTPMLRSYRIRLIMCLALSLPVLWFSFLSPFIGGDVDWPFAHELVRDFPVRTLLAWILSTPIQFGAAWPLYLSGYRALRYGGTANIDVLVMLSTTVAYVYSVIAAFSAFASHSFTDESFFETSAILLTLIILGRYLETLAKEKTSDVLHKLMDLQPARAVLLPKGLMAKEEEQDIDVRLLHHGDILKVVPGAKIPTDGVVVWGETTIDESMVTGESIPVRKLPPKLNANNEHASASLVLGGTINQTGMVYMRVTHTVAENALSNIAHMVQQAQLSKPPVQRLADRVSAIMVPAIVTLSFLVFFFWFGLAQGGVVSTSLSPVTFALKFALATLVVSCPCAVGLAVPTAIMVGTGVGAKLGILFADGSVIEHTRNTTSVVFDKTGTLTQGKPSVTSFKIFSSAVTESQFWSFVGSAEMNSEHALGRAMVDFARAFSGAVLQAPSAFQAVPGKGLSCTIDTHHVLVGNLDFLAESQVDTGGVDEKDLFDNHGTLASLERAGNTVVCVSVDNQPVGLVALNDCLKPEAKSVVTELTRMGIEVWMLSGDNERTTRRVASEVGIDSSHVMGRVLPGDKASRVQALQKEGRVVCMIGDGINDSPALAQADVGMAVGAGTDIALAAADVVLVKNDLRDVLVAMDLSRATFRRIKVNFFWAFLYNIIAIPLAIGLFYPLGGLYIPPVLAGLSELLSSLPVVVSSLLLKRYTSSPIRA